MPVCDACRTEGRAVLATTYRDGRNLCAECDAHASTIPTAGPWTVAFCPGEPITSAIQPGRRQDSWTVSPEPIKRPDMGIIAYPNACSIVCRCHGRDAETNAKFIASSRTLVAELSRVLGAVLALVPPDASDRAPCHQARELLRQTVNL
jgi:hypothetical protein